MAGNFVVAYDGALITHSTLNAAIEAGKTVKVPDGKHLIVYEVQAVGVVNPIKGRTNDDVTPPEGGTPILMRRAA